MGIAEDRLRDEKAKEDRRKKHQEEYRAFRQAINNIAKTKDGEIVLRHIAKLSGQFQSLTVVKGGQGVMNGIDKDGMLINSGRRDLYLDIRRPMSEETRRLIESKPTEGEEDHV